MTELERVTGERDAALKAWELAVDKFSAAPPGSKGIQAARAERESAASRFVAAYKRVVKLTAAIKHPVPEKQ